MIRRINGVVALLGGMRRPQPQHVHQPWVVTSCRTHSISNTGSGGMDEGCRGPDKAHAQVSSLSGQYTARKLLPVPIRWRIIQQMERRARANKRPLSRRRIERSYGVSVDPVRLVDKLQDKDRMSRSEVVAAANAGYLCSSKTMAKPEVYWFLLHKCNGRRKLPTYKELRDMLRVEFAELLTDMLPIERRMTVHYVNSFLDREELLRLAALVTPHEALYSKYPVYPRGDKPLPPRVRLIASTLGRLGEASATKVAEGVEAAAGGAVGDCKNTILDKAMHTTEVPTSVQCNVSEAATTTGVSAQRRPRSHDSKNQRCGANGVYSKRSIIPLPLRFRILQQIKQRADRGQRALTRTYIERNYGVSVDPRELMRVTQRDELRYNEISAAVIAGHLSSNAYSNPAMMRMHWFLLHKCNNVRKLPTNKELRDMLRVEFAKQLAHMTPSERTVAVNNCATSFLAREELLRVGALVTPHKALYRKYPVYPRGDKPLPPRVRKIASTLGRLGDAPLTPPSGTDVVTGTARQQKV